MSQIGAKPDLLLAATLKRLREERHVSQERLAKRAGITVSALSKVECGHNNPSWTTVTRIADALGVSLAELGAALEWIAR